MNDSVNSWLFQLKFWFLLILSIPSVFCSFLILIYFYQQKTNLSIHHHLTLLLTAISFLQLTTQIPLEIVYYRRGEVIPSTDAFCKWWTWWEYSLNGVSRFIMSWGSVERYFLIFHVSLMATKRKRFIFHLLPTIITAIFPVLFYLVMILFNPCKSYWDYTFVSLNDLENEVKKKELILGYVSSTMLCSRSYQSLYLRCHRHYYLPYFNYFNRKFIFNISHSLSKTATSWRMASTT